MRIDLKFYDKKMEKSYKEFLKRFQLLFLKCFAFYAFLLAILNLLLGFYLEEDFPLVFSIVNLVCVAAFFLFSLIKIKPGVFPQYLVILLQIYIVVSFVETHKESQNLWTSDIYAVITLLIEFLIMVTIISKGNWKLNVLTYGVINLYLSFRYTGQLREFGKRYPSLIYFINFGLISMGNYLNERFNRMVYYKLELDKSTLYCYQNLIKKILPTSIVILQNGKVVFFNQETRRLLRMELDFNVEKRLEHVVIKEAGSLIDCMTEKKEFCIKDYKERRLLDCLKEYGDEPTLCSFDHFFGVYNHEQGSDNITNLHIKIGVITWDSSKAVILILTEDILANRLRILKEQSNYKDKMLATVSHDLRTPMNGVIGILDMTLNTELMETQRKSLRLALRSSNLVLYMINDILDYSQISFGKIRLTPQRFLVQECLKEVSSLIKFQAKRKGVEFKLCNKLPFPSEIKINNDPLRLKQVLLNLLSNALKFTEKGWISLSVDVLKSGLEPKADLESIRLTVEDTGSGIKQKDIPNLFTLFGKLENEDNQRVNQSGIGLGLAISQNLVRVMNAHNEKTEINVESIYGKGSKFTFVLHAVNDKSTNMEDPSSPTNASENYFVSINKENSIKLLPKFETNIMDAQRGSSKFKKRVLIVDDDQINLLVFTKYFQSLQDYTFELANNGKQALELIEKSARANVYFDIVFMDCNMPIMDGFEASHLITQLIISKAIPALPIIASTANSSPSDYEKCFKSGMVDYISKPFTIGQLQAKLESVLGGSTRAIKD